MLTMTRNGDGGLSMARGVSPLRHPGYIAGRTYSTWMGDVATAAIAAVDTIYMYPFPVFAPITIKSLQARVVSLGAGSSVKMAMWADSPVSHRPLGAPLIADNTGQTTQANNTTISADTTDATLPEGWYWAGLKATGTLPTMTSTVMSNNFYSFFMGNSANAILTNGVTSADAYANDMPTFAEGASFSSGIVTMPVIQFTL